MKTINPNVSALNQRPAVDRPSAPNADKIGGTEFLEQLQALQNSSNAVMPSAQPGMSSAKPMELKFSNHAIDRMQARGVAFSPSEMARIQGAVEKAASKGAKNTLLLTDDSALIVSVKDKTVVTVMDKANLKENVFTNIDSTVMI